MHDFSMSAPGPHNGHPPANPHYGNGYYGGRGQYGGGKGHDFQNQGHETGFGGGGHNFGGHQYGGGEHHNLGEEETTIIDHIVTTIKNIINQPPTEKPVEDGDILNQGDMGAFTEATNNGNLDENIKAITEAASNGNLDENINAVFNGEGASPNVEDTVTKVTEIFTNAIETTTKYVKEIMVPEPEKHDYDDGMMSAHHHADEDEHTIYIILGVLLGVLVLIGVILVIVYWYYKRRGFHDLEGDNRVTVQKAKEPSVGKIEHSVCKEDTWLKAGKGGKK